MSKNKVFIVFIIISLTLPTVYAQTPAKTTSFNDSGWTLQYQENFDTDFEATDGQTFGTDNWLIFQLINDGAISVANGYAQLNAPDFWNAALIRSSDTLPEEYKIRTKIGYINYDLTNYEQADYDDPNFNTHAGHYENGMYFLTVTDDTCSGDQCAELWWHYHRKMVIDIDNHINWEGGGETFHPVYMVYMDPATNSGGNLLRTWDGSAWDETEWNWNVAYTYDYNSWYYAELEIRDDSLTLRLYDGSQTLLEETTPVGLDKIFAMNVAEYLYLGEPHTDDYEGNVRIDEITLLIPDNSVNINEDGPNNCLPRQFNVSQNYPNPFNPATTIDYTIRARTHLTISIYNILGQKIFTLVDDIKPPGQYSVTWDGTDSFGHEISSGIYFYHIDTKEFGETRKMTLMK